MVTWKTGAHPRSLGARLPDSKPYADRWPLSAAATVPRVPVPIGVNWYTAFDRPEAVQFGSMTRYFIGRSGQLGSIRGGHCVCLKPGQLSDSLTWWDFYDQGAEGACVGFGISRMATLLNRRRYDARWLWDLAKATDPWPETVPGDDNGTSVDAGMQILRSRGCVPWRAAYAGRDHAARDTETPTLAEGITAYRWAGTVDEIRGVLQSSLNDQLQAFPFLNSWGRSYPHITGIPYPVMERLLSESGEAAVPTDR
jgi:hypothetical protein